MYTFVILNVYYIHIYVCVIFFPYEWYIFILSSPFPFFFHFNGNCRKITTVSLNETRDENKVIILLLWCKNNINDLDEFSYRTRVLLMNYNVNTKMLWLIVKFPIIRKVNVKIKKIIMTNEKYENVEREKELYTQKRRANF